MDVAYPSDLIVPAGRSIDVPSDATCYGCVSAGAVAIERGALKATISASGYFAIPGPAQIGPMFGFLALRRGYTGLSSIGGPLEDVGRLRYIDGCSDTLLIGPPVKGDPCLNQLHVPPHRNQTAHTHPTVRIGLVVSGAGYCQTADGKKDLLPGSVFVLPPDEVHSFHTLESDLRIVVYHPDSDHGPTHEEHPMINRTYVDDVPILQSQSASAAAPTSG